MQIPSYCSLLIASAIGVALLGVAANAADEKVAEIKPDHRAVVVEDAGLWPNLVVLPKGRLLMAGFNQPKHTLKPGNTYCWDSSDGAKTGGKAALIGKDINERTTLHHGDGEWIAASRKKNQTKKACLEPQKGPRDILRLQFPILGSP